MDFGEQLKKCRKKHNMTREQVAELLNISSKAVSRLENGIDLPDPETVAIITEYFEMPFDRPISNKEDFEVVSKLIKDRKQTRRMEINLISFAVGAFFLIFGIGCIWIKSNSVEYIDSAGKLHESFFLIPMGAGSMACGTFIFIITGIKNLIYIFKKKI